MLRVGRVWAPAALCLAVGACGRAPQNVAATDVQAFLAAVQAGDAVRFEAAIDRPALRRDLRGQMLAIGRSAGVDVDGGPSEFALDRMIGPDNLHLAQANGGPLAQAPSLDQAKAMTRRLDKDHVCVHALGAAQACLLTFAREPAGKDERGATRKAGWRLVRRPAQDLTLTVPAAAAKK